MNQKWTFLLFLGCALTLSSWACDKSATPPETKVVVLHGTESPENTKGKESSQQVVEVAFKGGTKEAESLSVTFDLEKGKKLDGQRVQPVRIDPHNPTLGPEEAPVTWVIFGGWECPFSGRLPPVIQSLHSSYPDTLRIVFKHVAPERAKTGQQAARRLLMISNQEFWELGMGLLEKSPLTPEVLEATTDLPPLDEDQERESLIRLEMDQDLAESYQVRSTPQSFINGYRLTGVKSVEVFKRVIETELARAKERGTP
jgi:protein-disulfide isomerase